MSKRKGFFLMGIAVFVAVIGFLMYITGVKTHESGEIDPAVQKKMIHLSGQMIHQFN